MFYAPSLVRCRPALGFAALAEKAKGALAA